MVKRFKFTIVFFYLRDAIKKIMCGQINSNVNCGEWVVHFILQDLTYFESSSNNDSTFSIPISYLLKSQALMVESMLKLH